MVQSKIRRRRKGSRFLLRELLLLVCAAAISTGWAVVRSDGYLPTLDGNVYAMDPTGNSLFMVLSKEANNSLVHIDYNGNLLHYAVTETDQAFENLVVLNDTIYAVLTTYAAGGATQKLVALSMERASMSIRTLLDLADLPNAGSADITWTGAYLPLGETPAEVCLGGVDSQGNSFLLHWDLAAGQARLESILPGETVYKLKYVDTDHYVWIDSEGRLGQYIRGEWQRDLISGLGMDTPLHISTFQERVFVSDSQSGAIAELRPDGTASVCWYGGETIRQSGYRYRDIAIFTTREEQPGQIQVIGQCVAHSGDSNVVVGPNGVIDELKMGRHLFWLVLLHSWRPMLLGFALLSGIGCLLETALRSPRTAVRLAVFELIMAGVMLGAILGVQYRFYQTTIQEDARQKLQLLGGNLADLLTAGNLTDSGAAGGLVDEVMQRAPDSGQYSVNVVWLPSSGGPQIGYDGQVPYPTIFTGSWNRPWHCPTWNGKSSAGRSARSTKRPVPAKEICLIHKKGGARSWRN